MAIKNTTIVDTTSKYIVKSEGVGGETDQVVVDAEKFSSFLNSMITLPEVPKALNSKSPEVAVVLVALFVILPAVPS